MPAYRPSSSILLICLSPLKMEPKYGSNGAACLDIFSYSHTYVFKLFNAGAKLRFQLGILRIFGAHPSWHWKVLISALALWIPTIGVVVINNSKGDFIIMPHVNIFCFFSFYSIILFNLFHFLKARNKG